MTYERFEDLPVWQAAIQLAVQVYQTTDASWFASKGDLRNQLQRAALSVSNNIAEGFERGTTSELLMFLYIARGSAGEVRSACRFSAALLGPAAGPAHASLAANINQCVAAAERVSRQLRAWAASLQDGDITGQRHLTSQSKQDYQMAKRAAAFSAHVREVTDQAVAAAVRRNQDSSQAAPPNSPKPQ